MGAHPLDPGVDKDEVLETHRPRSPRRGLVILTAVLLAGGVAAGFKMSRQQGAPSTSPRPAASTAPPTAQRTLPPTAAVDASDVLLQTLSASMSATIEHHVEFELYYTGLTNVTSSTVRMGGPVVVLGHDGAPVPDTVAAITARHAATNPSSPLVARKELIQIGPHQRVRLLVRVRLRCSRSADRHPHMPIGSARIIVPLAGYRRPAVFRFFTLFSGLHLFGGAGCSTASVRSRARSRRGNRLDVPQSAH